TWITAFSGAIFGLQNIAALRMPAALLGLLLVLISYIFSLKLTRERTYAFVACLVMATSFYVVSASRDGNWDIYTHGFMMVCIWQLYLFFSSENRIYQHAILAAIFFGCSFMSKGPVSLYALLLPFLIAYGIVYRYRNFKNRWVPLLLFLVISAIISGWWHWYTYTFDPETVAEITKRETSNWTGYNVRPFYYYWSFFTQSGVWTIMAFIGLLYPYLKNRVFDKKAYRFTFLWTIISLVLLSIIPEKKSRYLLPVLIPLALNTGFYIEYLFRRFSDLKDKRETWPVYFNFGLISVIGLAFPFGGYFLLQDQLAGKWVWFILLSLMLFGIGIYMLRHLFQKKIKPVFFGTIFFIASIICFGMPLAKTLTVNPEFTSLAELNKWQDKTNVNVYELTYFTPELIWAYGKPIEVLLEDGKTNIPSDEKFGVLVSRDDQKLFNTSFKDFDTKLVRRYDMNPKAKGDRSHKPRLYRDLYLVSRR
ncbi:MAG: phospholipid carrier-dependent glycosyltransferase, partial [Flavobacteriaceae bacterium]|nr:phospholipid carrier-dependent glycosyltransferase [Flavobacteriaceae bacterium]